MTKEERLQNWKDIINGVFRAESDINAIEDVKDGKNWNQLLMEAKVADAETRDRVADEYVEAIAKQIMENRYMWFENDKF